ncbi:hypothetical protein DFH06DRAFT_1314080 [Mycena polygramma]|nr:hypothetical protein DFH06DRAFT_1351676 [Mycena polygramma]KAJ7604160.1 hypothetical protein DFH06DRAFT_1349601 [Mycena polygramma]KAJ7685807.1 hypothetical protein DFH06DRAFT_1314080 [Mycena polygramma]
MFSKTLFLVVAATVSAQAAVIARQQGPPPVFTATRVFQTTTDVPPYIITATQILTFTASPSTTFAHPTGPGA